MPIWIFETPPAIFIRILKTGSTSIVRGVFKGQGAVKDLGGEAFPLEWHSTFVFTFVRNPFDRLASCLEMFQKYPVKNKDEKVFRAQLNLQILMDVVEDESISINENNYLSKLRHHAIQMSHPSYHVQEADFIGRFESFDLDCRKLYLALGLKTPDKVPHLRSSPPRDYRDYFDDASRSRAEQIFAEDLERFKYRF